VGTRGTSREHVGNTLGTRKKNKRKPPTTPPRKGKQRAHHVCMLSLPIGFPLWTPSHKIGTIILPYGPPFPFIYTGVELWVNHMG